MPLELLRKCTGERGFVAAIEDRDNYRRIWARDGCIVGLAALAADDDGLRDGLRATLNTLARHQGPAGQIPSNVSGDVVSYGTTVGRVDATAWFVVGACLYGRLVDDALTAALWPSLTKAAAVLRAWEINDGGLVYVPVSGDWADEYVLSGYLLYDQLVRLWGQRELQWAGERLGRRVDRHPAGLDVLVADRFAGADHLVAGVAPGVVETQFDGFGNALACLLDVGSVDQRRKAMHHAASIARFDLVPAFHPAIEPGDTRYAQLLRMGSRNVPGRYHNGGLWPMIGGFWSLAAARLGDEALADRFASGVRQANEHGFPEYLDARDGSPGGTRDQAWSAAAQILSDARRRPRAASLFG